jgi:hypothetical protein
MWSQMEYISVGFRPAVLQVATLIRRSVALESTIVELNYVRGFGSVRG